MAKRNKNQKSYTPPKKKHNSFALWVTAGVVVVFAAIIGVVSFVNSQVGEAPTVPSAAAGSAIVQSDGGTVLQEGVANVAVFIDPMCPACRQFEETYTPEILATDDIGLTIHPITILDRMSGGTLFSTRASASIYAVAVAAPETTADYVEALFAAQPQEGGSGLTNAEIIAIADGVGATITENDISTYEKFVQRVTKFTPTAPNAGIVTPTVYVNGEVFTLTNPTADIETWRASAG